MGRTIRGGLLLLTSVLSLACAQDGDVEQAREPTRAACACPLDAQLDNLAVCVSPATAFAPPHVFSSHVGAARMAACEPWRSPQPVPSAPWSAVRISAPCPGAGSLCVRLRAGDRGTPEDADCVVTERCTTFDYRAPGGVLELSPLAAWVAESASCAERYEREGGYLELRTRSDALGCGSDPERITRIAVCPPRCEQSPGGAGCESCGGPRVTTRF